MSKLRIGMISAATLIVAGAIGFAAYRGLKPAPAAPYCAPSEVADLALGVVSDPALRQHIQALDAGYGAELSRVCGQLCDERAQLSKKLSTAKPGDPEVTAALERVHQEQARMETLTWNHILAVRDLLPAAERTRYLARVQANWDQGQSRLHSQALAAQCQMPGPVPAK